MTKQNKKEELRKKFDEIMDNSIEQLNKLTIIKKEEWEERFDKEFSILFSKVEDNKTEYQYSYLLRRETEHIKSFISQEHKKTREETIKEVIEERDIYWQNFYENCPQCVGLREKFREEVIDEIEKSEKIHDCECDDCNYAVANNGNALKIIPVNEVIKILKDKI